MNVFEFVTAAGQKVQITGPAGSTYDQALQIFNQQQSTGSLVGLKPGDTLNSLVQARGGLTTAISQISTSLSSGNLLNVINTVNTTVTNAANISSFVNSTVSCISCIPSLDTSQVQGLLASKISATGQDATEVSAEKGVGSYGLTPQQLEQAGLIKPGISQLISQDPANTVSILNSATSWTGKNGAENLDALLSNEKLQSAVTQTSLTSAFSQLNQLGVVNGNTVSTVLNTVSTVNTLADSAKVLGAVVNNASTFGVKETVDWLSNSVGGNEAVEWAKTAVDSIFGISFGSANKGISGGGNPLQAGIQKVKGYSNTVNRQVLDFSFNSIIGSNKVPKNIFANPALGIDIRTQTSQLAAINQSSSILLTQLAQNPAGLEILSKIPGAQGLLAVYQSGVGLYNQINGAAQLLDNVKNLPGVGKLLADVPGSKEILSSLQEYGTELLTNAGILDNLDVVALTDLDASLLLEGSDLALEVGAEFASEAFDFVSSFW